MVYGNKPGNFIYFSKNSLSLRRDILLLYSLWILGENKKVNCLPATNHRISVCDTKKPFDFRESR